MATKINGITATKKYFERADKLTGGQPGHKVETSEFAKLTSAERKELAMMAAVELGPEFEVEIQA